MIDRGKKPSLGHTMKGKSILPPRQLQKVAPNNQYWQKKKKGQPAWFIECDHSNSPVPAMPSLQCPVYGAVLLHQLSDQQI